MRTSIGRLLVVIVLVALLVVVLGGANRLIGSSSNGAPDVSVHVPTATPATTAAPPIATGSPAPTITGSPAPTSTTAANPTLTPTATPTGVATATATPDQSNDSRIRGFTMPIAGACLPSSPNLLPNAPRIYRSGVHEGIDFYDGLSCVPIPRGAPVLAAKGGIVIRADHDYRDLTQTEADTLLTRSQTQGYTDAEALDRFRGRQVWIDHGDGIVTRYCHLLGVAEGITEGMRVQAGQVIGYVGNSGTPEGVGDPEAENHLHFEIRIGDRYLGEGLSLDEVRRLLEQAFSP